MIAILSANSMTEETQMSVFYFHLQEGGMRSVDREGVELVNVDEAEGMAVRSARSIMAADVMTGRLSLESYIDVVSWEGERVRRIVFGKVLQIRG
jgi:hypothetical protein